MNYLQEILNFEKLQELNRLSPGQSRLWYVLMYLNNITGWQKWFTVASSTLEFRCNLSRSGIIKARNELKLLGYIDFKTNGRKATSYRMIPLMKRSTQPSVQDSKQDSVQSSTHNSTQSSVQDSSALYKQNKTKQNSSGSSTPTHADVFSFWQQEMNWGFPNGIVTADLDEWINEFGPDLVIYAMKIAGRKQVSASAADSFLNSVFNTWRKKQVKTIQDAQQANSNHEKSAYNNQQQRNNGYRKRQPIQEKLPAWFIEQREREKRGQFKPNSNPTDRIPKVSEVPMPDD